MNKDNKNTELHNTDKKLHISDVSDSLFDRFKEVINEYCSLNDATSVEIELNYHIKIYETRINNSKGVIINYH